MKDGINLNTKREEKQNSKHRQELEHRNVDGNILEINEIE